MRTPPECTQKRHQHKQPWKTLVSLLMHQNGTGGVGCGGQKGATERRCSKSHIAGPGAPPATICPDFLSQLKSTKKRSGVLKFHKTYRFRKAWCGDPKRISALLLPVRCWVPFIRSKRVPHGLILSEQTQYKCTGSAGSHSNFLHF